MHALEAVKSAAVNSGMSMYRLSKEMGKGATYMGGALGRKSDPRAETLAHMLEPCGYKLCAVPSDLVTGEMLVIDSEEE